MNLTDFSSAWGHSIAGEWSQGREPAFFATLNPATGEPLCHVAEASPQDVDGAVRAARTAFQQSDWRSMKPASRAELLYEMGRQLDRMTEEIGRLECLDSGKNLEFAKGEARGSARTFEYYAGLADKLEGRSIPLGEGYVDYTVLEPHGVSAQIVPWNFPVHIAARSVAPALAAGNTVVIKTPELAPLSVYALVVAAEQAGLPRGVINLVSGSGAVTGAALAGHPDIDQIVFTGSVATGQKILHAAADSVVPSLVELGGKSAGLVFPDADLEAVVDNIVTGIFTHAGQICSAMSRALVHEDVHGELLERLKARVEKLSVGPGEQGCDVTPVISEEQLAKIQSLCDRAAAEGAQAVTGGTRRDRPGFFFEPTVLAGVTPQMEIARTEAFGPVLAVSKFSTADEAIEIANGTDYGLVAGVFTHDLATAHHCAGGLEAGQVFVNEWFAGGIETPFGGVKKSGFGREKGVEALYNYARTKNVAIRYR